MTADRKTRPPKRSAKKDPYRYGWRLKKVRRNGKVDFVYVPLTQEDVLHPEEEDFIVNNSAHNEDRGYLKNVFEFQLVDCPRSIVLCDTRIAWDVAGIRPLGPDLAVIFDVLKRKNWATFDVAKERTRPRLIVEITSASTRAKDVGIKVDYYYRVGVPLYVIIDAQEKKKERHLEIIAYKRGKDAYEHVPLQQGRIWLDAVKCWLGTEGSRVACYDAEGNKIETYTQVTQARKAAEQRIRELEADLRRRNSRDGKS